MPGISSVSGAIQISLDNFEHNGAELQKCRFFPFWKDAQPDIPLLVQARKEYAVLT
jgi:hypothetical protein